jgi:hypothetical protein
MGRTAERAVRVSAGDISKVTEHLSQGWKPVTHPWREYGIGPSHPQPRKPIAQHRPILIRLKDRQNNLIKGCQTSPVGCVFPKNPRGDIDWDCFRPEGFEK